MAVEKFAGVKRICTAFRWDLFVGNHGLALIIFKQWRIVIINSFSNFSNFDGVEVPLSENVSTSHFVLLAINWPIACTGTAASRARAMKSTMTLLSKTTTQVLGSVLQ